jgi:hypothetical protein
VALLEREPQLQVVAGNLAERGDGLAVAVASFLIKSGGGGIDPSRELDVKAAKQANIEFADGKLLVKHPKLPTAFTTKFGSVVA